MSVSAPNAMEQRSARTTADFMFQSARGSIADDQEDQQLAEPSASASGSPKEAANSVIRLCVGGTEFVTTLATLTAAPGSYLAVLFGGRWAPSVFVPGSTTPFIDRDPASFKYVLAYLRSLRHQCQVNLPESPLELKQLHAEAEFYGLPGLARACLLGRFSSALNLSSHPGTPRQTQSGMYREPTFGTMQKFPSNSGSDSQAWNSFVSTSTAQRTAARHPDVPAGVTGSNSSTMDGSAAISGEDVQLHIHQYQHYGDQHSCCLAQSVYAAQQLLAEHKRSCTSQPQQRQLSELVLKHLLHTPLAARQPDLVAALAAPEDGTQLQFALQYYPIGDLRIEVECKLIPAGCTVYSPGFVVAPLAPATVGPQDSPSPEPSPRDRGFSSRPPSAAAVLGSRTPSGSLLPSLAAARSRPTSPHEEGSPARSSPSPTGLAIAPGPGWGGVVVYHKYSIRETPEKFTLTTHMPGEGQAVEEALRATYRPELNKYSTLHKLLVQQCPRSSVAGLIWSQEAAGFASVKLSTVLETYFVGANSFPGYKSILTFEL